MESNSQFPCHFTSIFPLCVCEIVQAKLFPAHYLLLSPPFSHLLDREILAETEIIPHLGMGLSASLNKHTKPRARMRRHGRSRANLSIQAGQSPELGFRGAQLSVGMAILTTHCQYPVGDPQDQAQTPHGQFPASNKAEGLHFAGVQMQDLPKSKQ